MQQLFINIHVLYIMCIETTRHERGYTNANNNRGGTDEEYLIFRAREEQKRDPCAAKCWMVTTQALFPQNFGIQVMSTRTNYQLSLTVLSVILIFSCNNRNMSRIIYVLLFQFQRVFF